MKDLQRGYAAVIVKAAWSSVNGPTRPLAWQFRVRRVCHIRTRTTSRRSAFLPGRSWLLQWAASRRLSI